MKQTRKRFLAVVMSLALIVGLLPAMSVPAAAEGTTPTISVGEQSGTVSVGSGSATFAVTPANFTTAPAAGGYSVNWYKEAAGTTSASAPTGITLTPSIANDGTVTLTAAATAAATAGTYYFTLTAVSDNQDATSDVVTLTVASSADNVAAVTFKNGTATNYTDFATAWNAAVGDSTTGPDATTFKLLKDWTATANNYAVTSFGKGAGFGYDDKTPYPEGYIRVPTGKNIIFDLNGHTLDRALKEAAGTTPGNDACAILNAGTLTLEDTSGGATNGNSVTGKITGTYQKTPLAGISTGCIWNDSEAVFVMRGGQITGNKSETKGAGVYNSGTFTMTGGKITANIANTDADAKGVGGGVDNDGTFTMTGGEISGNYTCGATMGGGVYNNGTMTVGGAAVITGNYASATYNTTSNEITAAGTANNVYLETSATVTVGSAFTGTAPQIGVTTQTTPTGGSPVAVTGNNTTDYSAYFHSDNSDYEIYNDNTTDSSAQVVKLRVPSSTTFDSRNGTAASQSATTPADNPTWGSYIFDGWYTDIDGTGTKLTGTPASGTTYYAKWTNSGKTVRTQALDLSSQTSDTANADEGWSYVASTKTLTLDGAAIDMASGNALTVPDGTKISVSSASTVATADGDAVYDAGALTVTGNGMLTVSGTACGIFSKGVLTFDHAHVDAKATSFAICSDNDNINIIGGDIKAAATAADDSHSHGTGSTRAIRKSAPAAPPGNCVHAPRTA